MQYTFEEVLANKDDVLRHVRVVSVSHEEDPSLDVVRVGQKYQSATDTTSAISPALEFKVESEEEANDMYYKLRSAWKKVNEISVSSADLPPKAE